MEEENKNEPPLRKVPSEKKEDNKGDPVADSSHINEENAENENNKPLDSASGEDNAASKDQKQQTVISEEEVSQHPLYLEL